MPVKTTVAAGLIALSALAFAAPASASGVTLHFGLTGTHYVYHDGGGYDWNHGRRHDRHDYGTLTPREVRAVLRDKGYRQIQYLDRRGRIYEVRATDYRGHRVGLVVSARNGAILNAYRF
jgi:hypothetical protein